MNVLVDTSVWVAHFRKSTTGLAKLGAQDRVLGHPLVLAEIACGSPPQLRARTLGDLSLLAQAHVASLNEVINFIEREQLYNLSCSYTDIALLASACLTPAASLWTQDKQFTPN